MHLIRQRMWSGRIAKARRGELAIPLPIGFARRPSGEVVLDPDEQVRRRWSGWSSTCSTGSAR